MQFGHQEDEAQVEVLRESAAPAIRVQEFDQKTENAALENLKMLQMMRSDFDTTSQNTASVASRARLTSDLRTTHVQQVIDRGIDAIHAQRTETIKIRDR